MIRRPLTLVALALSVFGPTAASSASATTTPSWMTVDAAKKSVSFEIKMAENGNNGTLNFNGYGHGDLTITVPVGWNVAMHVTNIGTGAIPHSLEIVPVTESIPAQGSDPPSFAGAETVDLLSGLGVGKSDDAIFTADSAGRYWMFCGVPNHGIGGMYDNFIVSSEAKLPSVSIKTHAPK